MAHALPIKKIFNNEAHSVPNFREYKTGEVLNWIWPDTEENFRKHSVNGLLNGFSRNDISYEHNTQGFRSSEFSEDACFVSLGCSICKGIGVNVESTYTHIVGKEFETLKTYNLGIGGNNNEYIFNQAIESLYKLDVKCMLISWTFNSRLLIINDKINFLGHNFSFPDRGEIDESMTRAGKKYYSEIYSPETHLFRLISYVNALDLIAKKNGVRIMHSFALQHVVDIDTISSSVKNQSNKLFINIELDSLARDKIHPGVIWHKQYSDLIIKHIL